MNPLAHPERLVPRVYAYVAYRIGPGPEAEDVTNDVFERALRYRHSYDPSRGEPVAWLLGIARRLLAKPRPPLTLGGEELELPLESHEESTLLRLTLAEALAVLSERERELIALRYGADLTARQIAGLLELRTNTVEVALHRTLARLRVLLEPEAPERPVRARKRPLLRAIPVPRPEKGGNER